MVGHQDAASSQPRMLGIAHHASFSAHDPGTTPQALPLIAAWFCRRGRFARTIRLRMVHRAASTKALGGNRALAVDGEFLFSNCYKRAQIGGRCSAVVEGKNLLHFEVKDVSRGVKTPNGLQTATRFQK